MQQILENPMVTGQATPRVFSDTEEFGTNTAARLVNDVVEEIRMTLESMEDQLKMYDRHIKEETGFARVFNKGGRYECQRAINEMKHLLEYAQDTKEYAL